MNNKYGAGNENTSFSLMGSPDTMESTCAQFPCGHLPADLKMNFMA